ncbi:unnamed protein product [Bursaphelenchus xylophilus]|uniref:(pine wood nematode) hypothetical protein n=1 Tax=Bursaphelenchus xylophilus TaxID=6326 RepID=A0A1I7RMI8_BURXY|nr:unnamed protein product [Bursaphelenchus xylophilus]CAG9118532.1 unnamed protein product [Bursaphelenchus xylophilus]
MTFCPETTRLDKATSLCCKSREEIYCAPPLELANDGIACPDTHPYNERKGLCCGPGLMLLKQEAKKKPNSELRSTSRPVHPTTTPRFVPETNKENSRVIFSTEETLTRHEIEQLNRQGLDKLKRVYATTTTVVPPLRRRKSKKHPRRKKKHRKVIESEDFDCDDFALPGRQSDCPYRRHLCHNKSFHSIMRNQCPKTCGYCNRLPAVEEENVIYTRITPQDFSEEIDCVDKEDENGVSECPKNKLKCLAGPFVHFMQKECPVTCGYCKRYLKRRVLPHREIDSQDYEYF